MSYRADKLMIDTRTDTHTHRQTQATTIPEGQYWPRVKMGRRNKKGKTRAGHRRRGHEGRKNICEAQSKQQNKRVVQGKNRKREQQQIQSSTPIGKDKKLGAPKEGQLYEKPNKAQASTIFKARSRMLPVKNNFRNKHQTQTCRVCGNHTETQQHVLEECEVLHLVGEFKVYSNEIFSNNTNNLKTTATNILDQLHNQPIHKEGPTTTTTCTWDLS